MKSDVRAFIADALDAAAGIERRVLDVTPEEYLRNEDLRLIIERLYITLAEALNATSQHDPAIASRIPNVAEIVAFRNILVHRYRQINPSLVHANSINEIPTLRTLLSEILAALDAK